MKRSPLILTALLLGSLIVPSVRAEDAPAANDLAKYLESLQLKLDHTAQRANQPNAGGSSVVGLRGSKQEPLSKQLYWKGKKGSAPVTPEEVKLVRDSIEQARAGRNADAIAGLKNFEQKYPKSPLMPDVEQTLVKLNAPAQ